LGDTASGTEQLVNQMNSFVKGANQTLADFGQRISKVERDVKALGEKPVATTPTAPARGSTGPVASSDRGETAPSGRVYEVKAGDTMEKIARQTNVSLADLLRLNPQVEPTRMKVGTKLNLP
jgi:LysM repeat protein